jgi:predicted  nucleic acid-binding Zn ribbon protein
MKNIIKNTEITVEEVNQWRYRGTIKEVPLMTAKHNAKVRKLLNELDFIRNAPNDPDVKIAALIDIMVRGIDFKC